MLLSRSYTPAIIVMLRQLNSVSATQWRLSKGVACLLICKDMPAKSLRSSGFARDIVRASKVYACQ